MTANMRKDYLVLKEWACSRSQSGISSIRSNPVLFAQTGFVNDIIDFMNDWIDGRIEILTEEELLSRNARLMADVVHDEAEVERWKRGEAVLIHELKQSKLHWKLTQCPLTAGPWGRGTTLLLRRADVCVLCNTPSLSTSTLPRSSKPPHS
jgi:hypothetical protein